MKNIFTLALATVLFISCQDKTKKEEVTEITQEVKTEKIISLNGAVTEILAALGESSNIVGVDVTSTYPEDIKTKAKDLGHVRSLSLESIIALQPTLIFASDKDLNDDLKAKITASGIQLELVKQEYSEKGTEQMIEQVAKKLGKTDYKHLSEKIKSDLAQLKPIEPKPTVLFIYARGAGTLMVAGTDTPVEKMIALAGGQNAVTEFSDYKPLTPESLIKGNPDVILLFTTGLQSLNGVDGLLKVDGISATKAGKNKRIIAMDGELLSGFGPRLGQAAIELNQLLTNK
ncbi:hemin ABC transporter substrate-binding protein [Flavobacterium sp. HSC-61S13]|uniref:heme/hemin ABC transporter substrate-binding protein n=1 Tax=Flavobacterium sp. HSC-61S13 TaxID=2910963 RepID=UPI0020A1C685|nr:ABC transporter substrate-binding protein [Flavobacterium sp. HSC-61S13]MCP1995139.1 iron complex transport system substrate-binding protein [Flavobacterium sp. HSC-61S13]